MKANEDDVEFILENIIKNPVCCIVSGKIGSGKTDSVCLVSQYLIPMDVHANFLTNIQVEHPRITRIYTDIDLIRNLNPDENNYLMLDECALMFATTQSYMSDENKFINHFLPMLRKFRIKSFFIYQEKRYINKAVWDFCDMEIMKPLKTYMVIVYNNILYHFKAVRTNLKFDTLAIASFTSFLNMQKVFYVVRNMSAPEAIRELQRRINDSWEAGSVNDELKDIIFEDKEDELNFFIRNDSNKLKEYNKKKIIKKSESYKYYDVNTKLYVCPYCQKKLKIASWNSHIENFSIFYSCRIPHQQREYKRILKTQQKNQKNTKKQPKISAKL